MKKCLVAYFSASGVTKKLAERMAEALACPLYEVKPLVPYTKGDLDWTDKTSRSSVEMANRSYRPPITGDLPDVSDVEVLFIAFPIWWYVAPTIVNTFLEQLDLKGKKVVPLATSGSSGMGETNQGLALSCPGAELCEGKRFAADASAAELLAFATPFLD